MRPTAEEQLEGTCRILETVVSPQVIEPFARTILANLIANLRMVTAALPMISSFLRDDNDATCAQLLAMREVLPHELTERIDHAVAAGKPDNCDGIALEERNRSLRELLAAAINSGHLTRDMLSSVEKHMVERASRNPMRYVPTVATTHNQSERS